ncbi:MAG: ABC transporter ATP-binding protein [Blautia sp.]|nr:ABC transporter ATP-binding protein [Blautia sp.]
MEIILDAVTKTIKHNKVLDHISCRFSGGHIYGIVGPNGSGKTMLLRTVSGLIIPTAGTVAFDGKRLHKDISFPPSMGLIIEKPEFLGYMTGLENLKLLAEVKKTVSEETIKDYMRLFLLDPDSRQTMRQYSLGMKQKIGIIQALMEDPDVLVLDEPFNALDEESVLLLRELLLERRAAGKLILLTSHHGEDIEAVCDQVMRMGRLG